MTLTPVDESEVCHNVGEKETIDYRIELFGPVMDDIVGRCHHTSTEHHDAKQCYDGSEDITVHGLTPFVGMGALYRN